MRKVDAKRLYQVIEELCVQSEDFGSSKALNVTAKEMVEGGLKPINLSDLKSWFNNVAIIAHFIDDTLFKSANWCLSSGSIKTFGGGNIPSKSIPKGLKIKLSEKDKNALYEIHEKIKTKTKKVRDFTNTYFDNSANISFYNTFSLSCYAMEIPQDIYDLCK